MVVKRLIADKEDTSQVFIILEALGSGHPLKAGKNLKHPNYSCVNSRLGKFLCDQKWLSSTGGSLGQHYYDFLRENISAEGLVDASEKGLSGLRELTNEEVEFHQRQRDAHDLWRIDRIWARCARRICLLAVTYCLLGNPGLLIIFWRALETQSDLKFWTAIREGFRHGRLMVWLPGIDWKEAASD